MPGILARELKRRGHIVRVLTGFPNFPEGKLHKGYPLRWRRDEVASGIPLRRVALFSSHSRSTTGRLANYGSFALSASLFGGKWFDNFEALWVFNSPPSVGVPTWLIRSRYRPRIVMHVMDLWPESLQASGFGDWLERSAWLRRSLDKWLSKTYDCADVIACTSSAQIELLAGRGVPREKLSYAPLWSDETIFQPMSRDDELAAEHGVVGKTVMLYAGTLGNTQGLDPLIEVCARLQDQPKFHCILAGAGVAEARLRARARHLCLTNVSFLGHRPTTEMKRLMSVGDIHFVSLRSNPLAAIAMPSKVQATLACAKPLIVAASGDAAEVVTRSGAGWACPPEDVRQLEATIRTALATDTRKLQEMGKRGHQTYQKEFSVRTGVDRLERLLRGGISGEANVA